MGVTATALKADDVVRMLRRHYLPEGRPLGGLFAAEVGSPDGRRRADAVWAPLTTAGGTGLVGHEVKVSRADVLVELADPTKAEPWAQYCHRWWLVVADPALVDGLDVPEAWGIMAPPSGRRTRTMTVVRPAPALHLKDPAPALRRLLAWQTFGTSDELIRAQYRVQAADTECDRLSREVAELRATSGTPHGSPHTKRIARLVHDIETAARRAPLYYADADAIDQAVVAAAVDHLATRRAAEDLRHQVRRMVRDVQGLTAPLQSVVRDLEAAEAAAGELIGAGG